MQGARFGFLNDSEHDGYPSYYYRVCIGGKVHVRYHEYAEPKIHSHLSISVSEVKPCDGSCKHPTVKIPAKVEEAIKEYEKQHSPSELRVDPNGPIRLLEGDGIIDYSDDESGPSHHGPNHCP